MSVQAVTIGDDNVQYRVITGQGTLTVAIKHIEMLTTLVWRNGKHEFAPQPHEVATHIEGRDWR
ncbi:hypothetical protein [Pseudomonas phage PSA11]|nr:hypothetical protein [Pseudomonas phage PSA11]